MQTGFSPHELLFGRKPRLPIDIIFGEPEAVVAKTYPEYLKQWRTAMEEAHRIAAEKAGHSAEKGRMQYNKKVRTSELKQGDRVLVKNLLEKGGPGKLRSFWENTIYEVVERKDPNNAVYTVKPLNTQGRQRVLHRNLLLPCPFLPYEADTENEQCRSMPQVSCNLPTKHLPSPKEGDQSAIIYTTDQDEDDSHPQFDPDQLNTAARLFSSVTRNNAEWINHEERAAIEQPEVGEMPSTTSAGPSAEGEQGASRRENSQTEEPNMTHSTCIKGESLQDHPQPVPRPQRLRHPPTMFTYAGMGIPHDSQVRIYPLYLCPVPPSKHQQPFLGLRHFTWPQNQFSHRLLKCKQAQHI